MSWSLECRKYDITLQNFSYKFFSIRNHGYLCKYTSLDSFWSSLNLPEIKPRGHQGFDERQSKCQIVTSKEKDTNKQGSNIMWSSSDLKVNYNHSVLNLDCNSQDNAIKLHYKLRM